MKILLTSGGTKIPIDKVRNITNMSKGTFGSKIATEFLKLGHDVMFLKARQSVSPFDLNLKLAWGSPQTAQELFDEKMTFVERHRRLYNEWEYGTFDEYRKMLKHLVETHRPDMVVLAAAVSDYGVEKPYNGKVRSKSMLQIKLKPLPKIIHLVKKWHPKVKLVGFKLLVNSKDSELVDAAKKSISNNKCDMVVANDLDDIRNNNHRVHLVFPSGDPITYETDQTDPNYLARMVAVHSVKL